LKPGPLHSRLLEAVVYEPATGVFTARVCRKGVSIGSVLGTSQSAGYQIIMLDKVAYLAHRLAWLYVHGEWPDCEVDHVNGNRSDNRISNLRLATPTQNRMNGARRRDNATGFRGVHFEPRRKKYVAQLKIGTQRKYLGQFDTAEAAHAAYLEAAKEFYGDFARSE